MRTRLKMHVILFVLLAALAVGAAPMMAQNPPMPVFFVYAVNFECGFQVNDIGAGGYEPLVKVANYATKVDFHNYDGHQVQVSAEVYSTANNRWTATGAAQAIPAGTMPVKARSRA